MKTSIKISHLLHLILKYTNLKESGGARTFHQIKQCFDIIMYITDFSNNKKEIELNYEEVKEVFEIVMNRLNEYGKLEDLSSKENKYLVTGIFNFYSKIVNFGKNKLKTTDELKNFKKTNELILKSFKTLIEKVPDLKSYLDKILVLESLKLNKN